ncbi:unnamed protein product, partial [Ectocarpus fasciculatus]
RLSSAWGEVVWKWQGGSSLHAELRGAVSVDDGHGVVVVGDSDSSPVAIKLDSNGTKLWEWNPETFGWPRDEDGTSEP